MGRQQGDERCVEAGLAFYRLQAIHFFNNQARQAFEAGIYRLNLMESAGLGSVELAPSYVDVCLGCGLLALHPLAEAYRRLAQEATAATSSPAARAYLLQMTSIYDVGMGRWRQVEAALDEAIQIYEQIGNWRSLGESLNMLALLNYYHGNFACVAELGAKAHALGGHHNNFQFQVWGLNLQAMQALLADQLEEAIGFLDAAWELLTRHNLERITAILNRGILAITYLRQGRLRSAREVVYMVGRFIGPSRPVWYVAFDGYAAMAQVYLALWEDKAASPQSDPLDLGPRAHEACQALRKYARVFPIGRPRAWLYQGWYDWLAGRRQKARQAWRKSLESARLWDMPYEEGLAHYEIGRHAVGAERQQHLASAAQIFTRLAASYDLRLAHNAMAQS